MKACLSVSASWRHILQKTRSASPHNTSTKSFSPPALNKAGAFIGRAPLDSSWCLSGRLAARETGTKAADQVGFLERLAKVALDPQGQHALLDAIIRIGGDEDRWDRVPCFDQMSVKLDPRYCRHVNIGDQAGGGSELGRCEEFGGGREHRNGGAQRLEQPSHGAAKGLVGIDHR